MKTKINLATAYGLNVIAGSEMLPSWPNRLAAIACAQLRECGSGGAE